MATPEVHKLLSAVENLGRDAPGGSVAYFMATMAKQANVLCTPNYYAREKSRDKAAYISGPVNPEHRDNAYIVRESIMDNMRGWKTGEDRRVEVLDPASIDQSMPPWDKVDDNKMMILSSDVVVAVPTSNRPCPGVWMEIEFAANNGVPVVILWKERRNTWLWRHGVSVSTNVEEGMDRVFHLLFNASPDEETKKTWRDLPPL